ncbi:MAG: hypothetical protein R3E91_01130 [Chlamydiales bacterium]
MTRVGKKAERRGRSPYKTKHPFPKTGSKKDHLSKGFKEHENAVLMEGVFIAKVKKG